jgi:hypothetical protein
MELISELQAAEANTVGISTAPHLRIEIWGRRVDGSLRPTLRKRREGWAPEFWGWWRVGYPAF